MTTSWKDYEIIATGGGEKLERWGRVYLLRPDPQAIWAAPFDMAKYPRLNARYVRSSDGGWLWLHAQKIHGSHAIIKSTSVPQDTINKVAAFVAHYSKASMSANVPIDYTLVKYVKKPSGAAPGKVIYTHQQTVNVTPKKPDEKNL